MEQRPDSEKPTLDRLKLRAREILAALLVTFVACAAMISTLTGRGERVATAQPDAVVAKSHRN